MAVGHREGDSGHPETSQSHESALHVLANSREHKTMMGNALEQQSHSGAMAGGDGCSTIWRSSVLFNKIEAREDGGAHCKVEGMERGI